MSITPISSNTVKWLKKLLGISSSESTKIIEITPTVAREVLNNTNLKNRALRSTRVADYKRFIVNDEWHLTQDAISFDNNGVLTNGQHRLTAIAESNKAVPVLVAFGIEASTAIDTGATRSISDNIKISDFCLPSLRDNNRLHKIFSSAYNYRNGYNSKPASPDTFIKIMNSYETELLRCDKSGLFRRVCTKGCGRVDIQAALFLCYLNGVDLNLLNHVLDILVSGVAESTFDSPIIGLRDELMNIKGGGREIKDYCMRITFGCVEKLLKHSKTKKLITDVVYTYEF